LSGLSSFIFSVPLSEAEYNGHHKQLARAMITAPKRTHHPHFINKQKKPIRKLKKPEKTQKKIYKKRNMALHSSGILWCEFTGLKGGKI